MNITTMIAMALLVFMIAVFFGLFVFVKWIKKKKFKHKFVLYDRHNIPTFYDAYKLNEHKLKAIQKYILIKEKSPWINYVLGFLGKRGIELQKPDDRFVFFDGRRDFIVGLYVNESFQPLKPNENHELDKESLDEELRRVSVIQAMKDSQAFSSGQKSNLVASLVLIGIVVLGVVSFLLVGGWYEKQLQSSAKLMTQVSDSLSGISSSLKEVSNQLSLINGGQNRTNTPSPNNKNVPPDVRGN